MHSYIEIKQSSSDPKKDKSLDIGLREFKKQIKKIGLMQELRRREAYMSPSQYRKFRKNEAIKRRKREEKKNIRSNEL